MFTDRARFPEIRRNGFFFGRLVARFRPLLMAEHRTRSPNQKSATIDTVHEINTYQ